MELNEVIKLKIDSITYEGNGSGTFEGETVFVPYTTPGDVVEARVKKIGDYVDTELIKILKKSQTRIEVKCSYFSKCGSCDFLHINYESQLEEKRKIIEYVFKKNEINFTKVEDVIKSPSNFNYRVRSKFKGEIDTNLILGFNKQKSHKTIDIKECPLLLESINKLYLKFRESLEKTLKEKKANRENIDAQSFELEIFQSNNDSFLVLNISQKSFEFFREFMNAFINKNHNVLGYSLKNNVGKELYKSNKITFSYDIHSLNLENKYKFNYDENCFTQVNLEVNELIINKIQESIKDFTLKHKEANIKILDLYSGIGNIGISVSNYANKVLCVEENPHSAKFGNENIKLNKANNVEFLNKSSESVVKDCLRKNEKFDIVILDPPRDGIGSLAKEITKINPKKIIYMSCDARTLSKDIKQIQDSGYRIKKITPFDMFPQTSHIEIVVESER